MSKSLPILIDTTTASTKATITTTTMTTTMKSESRRRPEAVIPSSDASVEKGKDAAENEGPPPSSLQPHSNHANVLTAKTASMAKALATAQPTNDNNHRQHDETEAIASITQHQNYQKQHECNNDYQITAKPLHDAHQVSIHDDGIVVKAGKNDNVDITKLNSMHGTLTTSRDVAKLSKMSPSTAKIMHNDIESVLTAFGALILIVTLVICTIVSLRRRIKSKKHCDKTNLINSSASCSSTTSINDCEMDFNGSTTSIAQMTAIHV